MSVINNEQKEKLWRKKQYYKEHPDEAHQDHLKQMESGSDDFIMAKIEKWEKEQNK